MNRIGTAGQAELVCKELFEGIATGGIATRGISTEIMVKGRCAATVLAALFRE
jgi:hypothetical protein